MSVHMCVCVHVCVCVRACLCVCVCTCVTVQPLGPYTQADMAGRKGSGFNLLYQCLHFGLHLPTSFFYSILGCPSIAERSPLPESSNFPCPLRCLTKLPDNVISPVPYWFYNFFFFCIHSYISGVHHFR